MATYASNEESLSISNLLSKHEITVEILPEKKGYLRKHVEYEVYSSRFNSQVSLAEFFSSIPI